MASSEIIENWLLRLYQIYELFKNFSDTKSDFPQGNPWGKNALQWTTTKKLSKVGFFFSPKHFMIYLQTSFTQEIYSNFSTQNSRWLRKEKCITNTFIGVIHTVRAWGHLSHVIGPHHLSSVNVACYMSSVMFISTIYVIYHCSIIIRIFRTKVLIMGNKVELKKTRTGHHWNTWCMGAHICPDEVVM